MATTKQKTWLITGAGGQLGSVLLGELVHSGCESVGLLSPTGPMPKQGRTVRADIADSDSLTSVLNDLRPAVIIHAAAITAVQAAYDNPDAARRINVEATARLIDMADSLGCRVAYISTDMVFGGDRAPYSEDDPPAPLSVYGRTKADAERLVLQSPRGLVIRPPLMYGLPAVARETTFSSQLQALRDRRPLNLFEDEYRSPMSLLDASRAIIEAAQGDLTGILHIAGPARLSRFDMGRIAADALGIRDPAITAIPRLSVSSPEPRPADLTLRTDRFENVFEHPPGRPMQEAMTEVANDFFSRR